MQVRAQRDNTNVVFRCHYRDRTLPIWNRKRHFLDELMHVREIVTNFHKRECGKDAPASRSCNISRYVVLELGLEASVALTTRSLDYRTSAYKRHRNLEGRDANLYLGSSSILNQCLF